MLSLLPWLMLAFAEPGCPPIDRLQEGATKGELTEQAVVCLQEARSTETSLEGRATISRLLIADSFAKGLTTVWSSHVVWHLENIDADDANLAYLYGLYLYKRGASDQAEKWSRHAIDNGYRWESDADGAVKRLNAYALVARATLQKHKGMLNTQEPSVLAVRASNGQVQLAAVQWLSAAVSAERDGSEALAMCIETGWDKERCTSRAAALAVGGL